MIVHREPKHNRHGTDFNAAVLIEAYLCRSSHLDDLIQRLARIAARYPDQAAGLLAARTAIMHLLWPGGGEDAAIGAA